MRLLMFRIVRNAVIVAFPLALLGYLLAELAGFGLASQPAFSRPRDAVALEELSARMRNRLPFTLAAWGVGLVTAFELLLFLVRGNPAPTPLPDEPAPHDDLYTNLLKQAETTESAPASPNTPKPTDAQP